MSRSCADSALPTPPCWSDCSLTSEPKKISDYSGQTESSFFAHGSSASSRPRRDDVDQNRAGEEPREALGVGAGGALDGLHDLAVALADDGADLRVVACRVGLELA